MTYQETLKAFKNTGLSLCDVIIAKEVYTQFTYFKPSDYERICELIKEAWLKSEYIEISTLVTAFYNLLFYKDLSLNQIDRHLIITEATNLMY